MARDMIEDFERDCGISQLKSSLGYPIKHNITRSLLHLQHPQLPRINLMLRNPISDLTEVLALMLRVEVHKQLIRLLDPVLPKYASVRLAHELLPQYVRAVVHMLVDIRFVMTEHTFPFVFVVRVGPVTALT